MVITSRKQQLTESLRRTLKNVDGKGYFGTIVQVARELDTTVSDISKDISLIAEQSEKVRNILLERHWPIYPVNTGYIFLGQGRCETRGEREKTLFRANFVLAEKLPQRKGDKRVNYEMFLPLRITERQICISVLRPVKNKETGKIEEQWARLHKNEYWVIIDPEHRNEIKELKMFPTIISILRQKTSDGNYLFQAFWDAPKDKRKVEWIGSPRIRFIKGRSCGPVESERLVNVNSDGR